METAIIFGVLFFLFLITGIVCFIWLMVLVFQISGNQKKTFNMLSVLLKDVAALKGASTAEIDKKPVSQTKPVISEVAEKLKSERKFPAPVASVSASASPSKSIPVKADKPIAKDLKTVPDRKPQAAPALKPGPAVSPMPVPVDREPSSFERRAGDIIRKIWNWIVVGEEFRNPNVSMEYAIAVAWLIRAGIIIMVVGGVFFVTYSIEKGLIGPVGRVSGMLLGGLTMVGFGLKLANKKYHAIAQGLLGGGIAMLYIGIFAGFSKFKIIDTLPAFALMIVITIAAGMIAVRLNSLLVAIFGVVGGYMTPVLINTGSGNLPGLYSYLILLGICTLWIAKYRDWKLLNAFAFFFTYLLFGLSMGKHYHDDDFSMAMTFLSLFFVLFSFIPILYNIINRQKSTAIELMFMFFNASVFFPTAYGLIIDQYDKEYVAIVTIALALFYIGQIYFFLMRKLQDKNFLIMLTGFASFFITFTIPLLLSDEWITTAWAIQALVFMWMSKRMKSNFIRLVAHFLYFLTFIWLMIFDLPDNVFNASTTDYWPEMLNRFMTLGMTILSLAGSYFLLKQEKQEGEDIPDGYIGTLKKNDIRVFVGDSAVAKVIFWLAFISLFGYLHVEFYYFCDCYYPPIRMTILSFIWLGAMIYLLTNYLNAGRKALGAVLTVFVVFFLMKLAFFDLNFWKFSIDSFVYAGPYSYEAGIMRLLDFLPAVTFFAYAAFVLIPDSGGDQDEQLMGYQAFGTLSLVMLFVYTTLELNTFLGDKAPGFQSGGISILWSLYAIAFVLSGILKDSKALRYSGLTLFVIVVAKVFFSDLSRLDQLYRIIAFIVLGVIILGGAFVYVRFKDFFETGEEKKETSKNN